LTIFGLPFLLAGLGVLYAGFNGSLTMESGGPAPMSFYIPFGGIFAAVGLAVVFGRSGRRLDRRLGTVTSWWGLLFLPLSRNSRSLDDFHEVALQKEVIRNNNSSRTVYRTYLAGPEDPTEPATPHSRPQNFFMMDTQSKYLDGRRECERVAKFLQLPMRDAASGSEQVRQPDELDISLRDLWKKEGKEPNLLAQPSSGRVVLTTESDQAVFDIPPSGFGLLHTIQILGAGIMLIFVLSFFGFSVIKGVGTAPGPFKFLWFGFGLLFVLPVFSVIASATKSALSKHRLTVSKDELILETSSPLGGSTAKIPMEQLEELELVNGARALEARSDYAAIRVGAGLDTEEVAWVKSMLEYIIVKGET
jgi:hypothetical protein